MIPEPPYLYDVKRPTTQSTYDPKRVTRTWAEAEAESRPTSTQSRPLIDFNRHPDSYMVVVNQDVKYKALPASTKSWVAAMRWIQFVFRVFQLLGAMGELFCVISLKPTDVTQAWIMRITPGYDILVTLYAVYHLVRSPKARTPGSSASYHVFAMIMDAGLIPFYAFIAVFTIGNISSLANHVEANPSMWNSFFTSTDATVKIILSAFYISCTMAGIHFISLCLDLYLIVVFRKIANLPPDLNPLEDNLTSRKTSKHKYKNSELSLSSTMEEKKANFYQPVPDIKEESRQIAFGHSRAGSDLSFSPHNPESARRSRQQYQVYLQEMKGSTQSFKTANSRAASPTKHDNWYVVEEPADVGLQDPYRPLSMNPPTPSPELRALKEISVNRSGTVINTSPERKVRDSVSINRSGTVVSETPSSVYSESAPSLKSSRAKTPKSKYYGDISAATRGIRGYSQVPQERVVSRSGADIADEAMTFIPDKSRRRMVSGKAAEEGVAGYWY